jgi:hypothetical protein
MSANDTQISGNHYKDKPIQPWSYIAANGLGTLKATSLNTFPAGKTKAA